MTVEVRYYTDPACSWSWGTEPKLRRLIWEFGAELRFTWVMGGLARQYGPDYRDREAGIGAGADCFAHLMAHWLDVALAAGARAAEDRRPEPLDAIERFGRCATRELEELTGQPRPVLEAELWGLVRDWKLRPLDVSGGTIWEAP